MAPSAADPPHPATPDATSLRHEAFLYRDDAEYVDRIAAFAEEAAGVGASVLVAADAGRLELVRDPWPPSGRPSGWST